MIEKSITMPIRYLKGVGPKRAELLAKLGVNTIEDIVYYLPHRYEDRTNLTHIRALRIGQAQCVKAKVVSMGMYNTKKMVPVFQLTVTDGTGVLYCLWYNMPFIKKNFSVGQTVVFYGKVERFMKLHMSHPDYEITDDVSGSSNMGRIVPVYSLTKDITARYLRTLVSDAITNFSECIDETLPPYIKFRHDLLGIHDAVKNIHFPDSFELLEKSYRRLVFEEFLVLQIALAKRREVKRAGIKGKAHRIEPVMLDNFKRALPFSLSAEQEKVIKDIERDMASEKPMRRLLEGDVGSGKTAVAMYALYLAAMNDNQGVIMAPTEILARQHYMNISETLMPLGINVRLLVSGIPDDKRTVIKDEIARGEVDIVCGTHALIQEEVAYKDLTLAVIDEQHKFGVEQRDILLKKGLNPHLLAMTATPIPRTLVLTVFGDMDMSVIKSMPKGKRPVTTFWLGPEKRKMVYEFLREEVRKGRQCYIVCPLIKKGENEDIRDAEGMYTELEEKIFPDLKLAMIHGKTKPAEKESIMKKFKAKGYDMLVSTVVIEVGIDVPNATAIVIENAERFGLAQLHQLRGRVGRGGHESYCILIGEPKTEESAKRLSTMVETSDGFEIAEEDLEIRGPGEFFGTRQHGLPELRFGNILKDFEIMEEARGEAFDIIKNDPGLDELKHAGLKRTLANRFKVKS